MITEAPEAALREAVLEEALTGLTSAPKTLSPWLFYDERGSQLFEAITALPEYYLTRTERAIFAKHGPSLPLRQGSPVTIVELGAGSASKTGILLQHFADHQGGVLYQPIDISPTALDEAACRRLHADSWKFRQRVGSTNCFVLRFRARPRLNHRLRDQKSPA